MSYSIVILSRDAGNLVPCIRAILENEPGIRPERIIVVDDGARAEAEAELPGITWASGRKPFCFAANANIGIREALERGADSVILCNDDALLQTSLGFTGLWGAVRNNPEFGVIASSCNTVGNVNQHRQLGWGGAVREDSRMVCYVTVLIPRRTFETVGFLDESLTMYGLDDDDHCLRMRQAGLKIGIWDGCFMDHGSLKSSYRGTGHADFRPNLQRFIAKHGVDNWGKTREESQFKELFPA